ncbi:twin-arginine translocation protein, TatB subunit [Oleidesulfovibrio alaskensis G20]|jgi:sec-independent protein translocase protein TatB|uniref:Sec-independent protein translocase protein TatB homolog n=1 Tax=Oleidesulfovibrio alaskensis (strain ATCC BAA-1058 / DSM 17464 / G20) TaxID=207559 RepID=Q311X8_OLEA2|nr:Sec-independent protein translocase protein TatB [Oleidesulfovibrio alaskensis]ABB38268.1 twin-arginine translocation protein, TatB subunit [Oleidesulfovibrio alaskensis G20]MBG0774313.1 twin-arginine translocase subunit TatB [Oleidesulfovibrio alaskensis]
MFGIGTTELLVILVVALIVLGPKNLPKAARTLGKGLAEFRRVSTDFQRTINTEVELEEHEKRKQEARKDLYGDDETPAKKKTAKAEQRDPDAKPDIAVAPDSEQQDTAATAQADADAVTDKQKVKA